MRLFLWFASNNGMIRTLPDRPRGGHPPKHQFFLPAFTPEISACFLHVLPKTRILGLFGGLKVGHFGYAAVSLAAARMSHLEGQQPLFYFSFQPKMFSAVFHSPPPVHPRHTDSSQPLMSAVFRCLQPRPSANPPSGHRLGRQPPARLLFNSKGPLGGGLSMGPPPGPPQGGLLPTPGQGCE